MPPSSPEDSPLLARFCRIVPLLCCLALALPAGRALAAEGGCAPHLRAQLNISPLGAPVVTLNVNGAPVQLLLDTGAERTVLTAAAARRVGLRPDFRHARLVRGFGSRVRAAEVRAVRVAAGSMALPALDFMVVPLSLPRAEGEQIDGVLGADMLDRFDIDLNFGQHIVLLYDPADCANPELPWLRDYVAVPGSLSRHLHVAFPITLDGHALTAFIDTGAERSLLDSSASGRLGLDPKALRHDEAVEMQGVSSRTVTAREHRFNQLGVADEVLLSPTVGVTALRMDDADVLVGADLLNHERIWLSYAAHRIYIAYVN